MSSCSRSLPSAPFCEHCRINFSKKDKYHRKVKNKCEDCENEKKLNVSIVKAFFLKFGYPKVNVTRIDFLKTDPKSSFFRFLVKPIL